MLGQNCNFELITTYDLFSIETFISKFLMSISWSIESTRATPFYSQTPIKKIPKDSL